MNYLSLYLLIINAIGLSIMYIDKQKAIGNRYRIPEKTLWIIAILGGALGETVAMKWFRHKTKHTVFKWGLPSLAIVEFAFVFWVLSIN